MIEAKEAIKHGVGIKQVIESYTTVRGNKARCPFHHPDNHPSLSFSESKGVFHCWSCGESGDTFTFVMKAEGVSFPEAVKILSDRYGIACTYNGPKQVREFKRQTDVRNAEILRLQRIRDDEKARLDDHDAFMSNLWKKVYQSNGARKEEILEVIEACFMIIDEEHKKLEGWYDNESRKVYGKKAHKISGGNSVSQV